MNQERGGVILLSAYIVIPLLLIMIIAVYTDVRKRLIYDWLTLPGIVYFLLVHAVIHPSQWLDYVLGVVALGGITLLLAVFSKGQLGGGDIKLFALLGAALGWVGGGYVLLLTYLIAGLYAIPVWLIRFFQKKKKRKEVPLAPFIAGGTSLMFLTVWFYQ